MDTGRGSRRHSRLLAAAAAGALATVAAGAVPGGGGAVRADTVELKAVADAFVTAAQPRRNFGRARTVEVARAPLARGYLRFRVAGVRAPVRRASLRLYVTRGSGSGFSVVSTGNGWSEGTITFARAPRPGGTIARARAGRRGWTEVDLTSVVRGNGTFSVALAAVRGRIAFASREVRGREPRLVVETASPPPPVIAAVGDIACDPTDPDFNGGQGTATRCRQAAVASLLDPSALAAVLPLGDVQYECGGFQAFMQSYDRSWGRVKAITRPALGNHEYKTSGGTDCDRTGRALGFFRYFGAVVGSPDNGYYSYDLGTWHLVVLNSECSAVGGCGPGSPQERWLRADLAASRRTCTLAYWHHPLFSSGKNGNHAEMRAVWQALHEARAEVVLSGHDHDYERFGPQDADGRADAGGIREFVVGTGGEGLSRIAAALPNSEVRDDTTLGVLQLTLRADGYDWRFVPETGKTFTDSGSGSCR